MISADIASEALVSYRSADCDATGASRERGRLTSKRLRKTPAPHSGAQGIDYSRLTAVLVQAVKEQQEEIKQLKAPLDTIGSQQ